MVNVHPADAPEIPHCPGTFTWTQGLFFLSCPHTWCRWSSLSRVIYPDSRAVIFGFLYILQMLQKFCIFLGDSPGQGGCFIFGFFPHYLPRQKSGFFQVLCTLHHPGAPAFLGTFTWTWGLFFSDFLHTASSNCSGFAQDIYLDTGVVFFRFSAHCIIQGGTGIKKKDLGSILFFLDFEGTN